MLMQTPTAFAPPPDPYRVDWRAQIRGLPPEEACAYLLDAIDWLIPSGAASDGWDMPGLRLQRGEKRLLRALALARGAIVSRDQIAGMMWGDRPEQDWPETKVIDVYTWRLRRMLAPFGIEIDSVYGVGLRMTAPKGFVWPWEAVA